MFVVLSYPKLCVLLSWFYFISFFKPKTRGTRLSEHISAHLSALSYCPKNDGFKSSTLVKPNFHQKTWLASKSLLSCFPAMLGQTSPDKRGAEGYRRPPSLSFHWLFFFLSFLLAWVVSCGGCSCVSLHTRKRYTFSHKFSSCYPLRQQPGPLTLGFYIITFAFFEGIERAPVLGNQCLQSMNILNESWIHYFFCRCNNNAWLTQTPKAHRQASAEQ